MRDLPIDHPIDLPPDAARSEARPQVRIGETVTIDPGRLGPLR